MSDRIPICPSKRGTINAARKPCRSSGCCRSSAWHQWLELGMPEGNGLRRAVGVEALYEYVSCSRSSHHAKRRRGSHSDLEARPRIG